MKNFNNIFDFANFAAEEDRLLGWSDIVEKVN